MRAILHLGGNPTRIDSTIEMLKFWPDAMVIFGTPENPVECYSRVRLAGVPNNKIVFDFRAWDTVTNFTVIADIIKKHNITDICIVTDKFHMFRSRCIGTIVYGFTSVTLSTHKHIDPEMQHRTDSILRTIVDVIRTVIWKLTGLLVFNPWIKKARMSSITEMEKTYQMIVKPHLLIKA